MSRQTIDSRYPPQLEAKVPLYPEQTRELTSDTSKAPETLQQRLYELFGDTSTITTLGYSASSLVSQYVMNERVGLPHFSCQSLADAVIDAGATPVFYDINADATISDSGVDFALNEGCGTFIWPTFFGASWRDGTQIDKLRSNGLKIIFDDAQADFFSSDAQRTRESIRGDDTVLYSFGSSKLLAGTGGGAIQGLKHNSRLASLKEEQRLSHYGITAIEPSSLPVDNVVLPLFATQEELLEARGHIPITKHNIDDSDALSALQQIERHLTAKDRHAARYSEVRGAIIDSLGLSALRFIEDINPVPTILALRVDPTERYDMMSEFAELGIQPTWYYHPIHRISRYSEYLAQDDEGAASVANSVIILPFQWTHTDDQVEVLIDAINKIGSA